MMSWKDHFKLKEFGLHYNRPQDFVTLQHGSPILYVIWSSLWLAYHLIWILLEAYWSSSSAGRWMLFLTNLSYVALTVFAFIDFIVCIYVFCLRTDLYETSYGVSRTLPWYMKVQWICMNISGHAAIQVTLIYWIMLASSTRASTINKHGINLVYMLLLICFSAKPMKFQHVYQAMLSSLFYVILNVIYHSATGTILYPFLDWSKPTKAVLLSIGFIFASTPLSFFILFGVYKLRMYVYNRIILARKEHQKEDEALQSMKFENYNHA